MLREIPLRKLLIELRYNSNLGFYGKMDGAALALSDQFPDWERTPLTVEIRNKKKRRRIFLAHRRCFFECDLLPQSPVQGEIEFAMDRLDEVVQALEIAEFTRIGMRQWVAADLGKTFALIVDEFQSRFHHQGPQLAAIISDQVSDVAYVVDCETREGWKYHLQLGPMTKEEWFQPHRTTYEQGVFEESDGADAVTFSKYRETIPDNFLYLDVDCYRESVSPTAQGVARSEWKSEIVAFRRRSHELIAQLIEYCRG